MLNLPSPALTTTPPTTPPSMPVLSDVGLLAAPETQVTLADGRDGFGELLAASIVPVLPPVETPVTDPTTPPAEITLTEQAEDPAADAMVAPALSQPWALVLVPELASLPAPAPGDFEDSGDALGRGIANQASTGLWPQRSGGRLLLGASLPPIDASRPRGWQNALPSLPLPTSGVSPPAAPTFVLRTITGQPIPYPTADQPPWYDPAQAPPWFDRANPPPPWSDPTRPAPLWYDPTQVPPAWLDPARIPAAWFDPPRLPGEAAQAVLPATPASLAGPAAASTATPIVPPPPAIAAPPRENSPIPRPERRPRAAHTDPVPPPAIGPVFTPPALPPAATTAAAPATATPAPPPPPPEPTLAIASERLGEVAVRLSGGPEQLQVAMQAQPAAAALLGAEAPRLNQDLAAAGVALASLSVNGQRTDLGGGQRDRQRQSGRREADVPLTGVRRLAARPPVNRATSVDRFA